MISLNESISKQQILNDALSSMNSSKYQYDLTHKNAWYNSPVATSSLHASVMDEYHQVNAWGKKVEEISSSADVKSQSVGEQALNEYSVLFPFVMNLLGKLS